MSNKAMRTKVDELLGYGVSKQRVLGKRLSTATSDQPRLRPRIAAFGERSTA
jgi:hypothetical protein